MTRADQYAHLARSLLAEFDAMAGQPDVRSDQVRLVEAASAFALAGAVERLVGVLGRRQA